MRIEQDGWCLEVSELATQGKSFALFVGIGRTDAPSTGWRLDADDTQNIMETCARALANLRKREAQEIEAEAREDRKMNREKVSDAFGVL